MNMLFYVDILDKLPNTLIGILKSVIVAIEANTKYHINNFEDALNIISKISVLYRKLGRKQQKVLLRQVVMNPVGES